MRAERRTGLVTFATAGDPDLPRSAEILRALDRAGADVLEVGVPFSDPLADGPVIQRATERAGGGGQPPSVVDARRGGAALRVGSDRRVQLRESHPAPRRGSSPRQAAGAGVDGVLALDLPIEEAGGFRETMAASGLDTVFLLSPTTTDGRIGKAAELGSGFLYGISRLGVTGARDRVAEGAREMVARIRAQTSMPVALGFGISRPEHVAEVGAYADAAVVGSALVSLIAEASGSPAPGRSSRNDYVRWLSPGRTTT